MSHISENGVRKICEICDRYTDEKTPLMMILSDIQNEYGYIPLDVQEIVSQKTGISVAEIYGVVTFYSFFSLQPKGKYIIGCCLGTACYVKGAQQVIDKFSELLGRSKAPRHRTVFFHRDGQIAGRGQRAALHCLQDRRILEHHAAAAQHGKLYLRVVDYKTGKKSFDLAELRYGLGLQMLLYLFTLKEEGQMLFGGHEIVPAGVLYTPARVLRDFM